MNSVEWIEFHKERPKDGQRVLYYFEVTGSNIGRFSEPNVFHGSKGFLTGDVTHWYPLPEDPEIKNPGLLKYLEEKRKKIEAKRTLDINMSYQEFVSYTNKLNPNSFETVSELSNIVTKLGVVADRLLETNELKWDHWCNIKVGIFSLLFK